MPVVLDVVTQMDEFAESNNIPEIKEVVVEIGEASGVVPFFFQSCWDPAVARSKYLLNATLSIEEIPTVCKCRDCKEEFHPKSHPPVCPKCNGEAWDIIAGREIQIKEILVE